MSSSCCVLILAKELTDGLYEKYKDYPYPIFFVTDTLPPHTPKVDNVVHYDSEETIEQGYVHMTTFLQTSAWDKAVRFFNETRQYDFYWMIEDDVYVRDLGELTTAYSGNESDLIIASWYKSYANDDSWYWWKLNWPPSTNVPHFRNGNLKSSLNVICRVSKTLLEKVIEFKNRHHTLLFHELLFPSLCDAFDLQIYEISQDERKSRLSAFRDTSGRDLTDIIDQNNYFLYHPDKRQLSDRHAKQVS